MSTKPLVLTFDTNLNENSHRFLKSMTNQGWSFRLIGTDKVWKSFLQRVIEYRTELIKISLENPNQLCVISDCKDVLGLRIPKHFEDIFKTFNCGVVVSGEILCAGYTDYKVLDPEDFKRYNCEPLEKYWESKGYILDSLPMRKYVNAGLICGYVNNLIEMYDWVISKGREIKLGDDQVLMGMYMNEYPQNVEVDVDIKLLHTSTFGVTAGYMSEYQNMDSPTISQILGRGSFFLHIPGINTGRGNKIIYDMISLLIDNDYTNKKLIKDFNITEENIGLDWYMEDKIKLEQNNGKS
jgi:hypothetical protein